MEQGGELVKLKKIVRRRWAWLFIPFCLVVTVVTGIALVLPNIYRSSAMIMVENAHIPQNLVSSTVIGYTDQRIQAITQEMTSRSRILNLVDKYDLLAGKRDKLLAEELVDRVKKRINVESVDAEIKKETLNKPVMLTIAFKLSYDDEDPRKAQLVTNEFASYYLEKNLEVRSKSARSTTAFLEDQLGQSKTRVERVEAQLAAFREAHLDELPDFTNLNMQKVEKLNTDLSNLNMQIRSLEEQKAMVKSRLASVDPYISSGSRVPTPEERLRQAQLERAMLAAKYSAKHPSVQAKNQEISLLQWGDADPGVQSELAQKRQELEARLADMSSRYTDKHPSVLAAKQELEAVKKQMNTMAARSRRGSEPGSHNPTNPAYLTLKVDLEKMDSTIASLQAEKIRIEEEIKRVYEKLYAMPKVAKEYNELTTEAQNAKAHYNELQQKLMAARVGQGMEEEKLGENFQVVEPAFLPEMPAKPNRLAIILIGIVLGAGLSVGLASVREYADNSVHDLETLESLVSFPVLSLIPNIVTKEDVSRARRRKAVAATCIVGGLVLGILSFHVWVMDLDVFYAKLMRFIETKLLI